ncbi:MAG: LCP family protein [Chloroflexota bacterium]
MAAKAKTYQKSILPQLFVQGLVLGMTLIFLAGGAYTGYLFYYLTKDTVKTIAARTNLSAVPYVDLALPINTLPITGDGSDAANILPIEGGSNNGAGVSGNDAVVGDVEPEFVDSERINILLMGIDKRPDELYSRTDTMILVTIDSNTRSAGMLSVPRDLWVAIPGYDEDRVNKAYFFGDKNNYPGGGPALAKKTLQYNLGVPVHYFIEVDFDGFRQVVDTLGGIDIEVPETIDDPLFPDNNYGYDPFYIEAGSQTLDGYDALRYARTRATAGADFSRARRQQQVLLAIRDKALQLNMIPKIPELWATMSGSFDTDLDLAIMIELAQLSDQIQADNIKSEVIDTRMTVNYVVPETGAQVLLPLREKIRAIIDEMFVETEPQFAQQPKTVAVEAEEEVTEEAAIEEAATPENQERAEEIEQEAQRQQALKELLQEEDARLVVQNGTKISGLASQSAAFLKQSGFNIVQFGPADANSYTGTVVVVYDDIKTDTLEALTTLFDVQEENIRLSPNLKSDVDFRVIIGSDFELPEGTELLFDSVDSDE